MELPLTIIKAQGASATLNALSEIGLNVKFLIPTVGLIVLLILFFIIAKVVRKSRSGHGDIMAGISYLDVTGMKKQGLLTEEEMANIRAAMSRQVDRQRAGPAIKAPPSLAGELALMADPEVQRLEAVAAEHAKMRLAAQNAQRSAVSNEPAPQPQPKPDENYGDPIPADFSQSSIAPPPMQVSAELDASAWQRPNPETARPVADEIVLPADVVKMAELGLITPEEMQRIKERIRQKRAQLP
ncbi:MAG: FeoB-associated Cys-rich membrane protein [Candidatus Sumerlaeaceae bacterium]